MADALARASAVWAGHLRQAPTSADAVACLFGRRGAGGWRGGGAVRTAPCNTQQPKPAHLGKGHTLAPGARRGGRRQRLGGRRRGPTQRLCEAAGPGLGAGLSAGAGTAARSDGFRGGLLSSLRGEGRLSETRGDAEAPKRSAERRSLLLAHLGHGLSVARRDGGRGGRGVGGGTQACGVGRREDQA